MAKIEVALITIGIVLFLAFLYCITEFGRVVDAAESAEHLYDDDNYSDYGRLPFVEWFAWYPVRDEDGNWIWFRYVQIKHDGRIVRFPSDVD